MNPTELQSFIASCKETRDEFVKVASYALPYEKVRTAAESLIIMYDQLIERLATPPASEPSEQPVADAEAFLKARWVTCARCQGDGYLSFSNFTETTQKKECPECDGTGLGVPDGYAEVLEMLQAYATHASARAVGAERQRFARLVDEFKALASKPAETGTEDFGKQVAYSHVYFELSKLLTGDVGEKK